jgi:hypothetical protein
LTIFKEHHSEFWELYMEMIESFSDRQWELLVNSPMGEWPEIRERRGRHGGKKFGF